MNIDEFLIIAAMALVTFAIRAVLLLFSRSVRLQGGWERALNYVPPAVLTAITVPAVLMPTGSLQLQLSNHYLVSGIAALGAGLLFRRQALWAAIITGLAVFALWRLLGGVSFS